MARNNHWSNHRLLVACKRLPDQDYFARRPSFFGSIHATLDHLLIVQLLYLGRMTGEELVAADCEEFCAELDGLIHRQYTVDNELIRFCRKQDDVSLDSSVSFKMSTGQAFTEKISDVLTHLFIHQVHHRGQVHDMLSSTSVAPPQLDEFFLNGDLPSRQQELADLGLSTD